MSLFAAFNAVAAAAAVRRQYRRVTELPSLNLYVVASMEATETASGRAIKICLDTTDGASIFTFVNMDLAPETCQEAARLYAERQPAYFFTASGNGRRVNGLVPFGVTVAEFYGKKQQVNRSILPENLAEAVAATGLLPAV